MRLRSQLREFLRITPRESTNAQVVVVHVSVDTKQLLEDRTTCLHEGLWKDARSALIERGSLSNRSFIDWNSVLMYCFAVIYDSTSSLAPTGTGFDPLKSVQ